MYPLKALIVQVFIFIVFYVHELNVRQEYFRYNTKAPILFLYISPHIF